MRLLFLPETSPPMTPSCVPEWHNTPVPIWKPRSFCTFRGWASSPESLPFLVPCVNVGHDPSLDGAVVRDRDSQLVTPASPVLPRAAAQTGTFAAFWRRSGHRGFTAGRRGRPCAVKIRSNLVVCTFLKLPFGVFSPKELITGNAAKSHGGAPAPGFPVVAVASLRVPY